jgi:23S rRNA (cytosine1962-C5)-methyltransferase
MIKLLTPDCWKDYELIDSGGFEKLERFGDYTLIRPEPQACWNKSLPDTEWKKMAHVRFLREKSGADKEGEKGRWEFIKKMPEQWFISYQYKEMALRFRLGLTAFKHVGIFPEQAENWNFIFDTVKSNGAVDNRLLNLFAYTGGASLAARSAGADVVHVDSVKPVVSWARENMEASGLADIRWVIEDAMKFVRREVKRGNKYNGIILDPPAYGRGPEGEKWVLEENINELMQHCAELMSPDKGFLVLNLYSMGFSSLVANNLLDSFFNNIPFREFGEFYFSDNSGKKLPLGTFLRMKTF